ELAARGTVRLRQSHVMTRRLDDRDLQSPGSPNRHIEPLSAAQLQRHAMALAALNMQAYPEVHPDAYAADEAANVSRLNAIARGEVLGPLLAESRIAVAERRIVGACLVVDKSDGEKPDGPWVA